MSGGEVRATARLIEGEGRMSLRVPIPDGQEVEMAYAVECAEGDGLWELHLGDGGWSLVDRGAAKRALLHLLLGEGGASE